MNYSLPRILVIDDLFGRVHANNRNEERANLCGQYLLEDITGDEVGKGTPQKIKKPIAQAVFYRGQIPVCSSVGDTVENDLDGVLQKIQEGWRDRKPGKPPWAMVLLDLCFYTGQVTQESDCRTKGMPVGRDGDNDSGRFFGMEILRAIHDEFPTLPVVVLSSMPRQEVSHEYSFHGALGFIERDLENGSELLKEYIGRHGLLPDSENEIVGYSTSLLLALRSARKAAARMENILIRGERGTGKELLANFIRRSGFDDKKNKPSVLVNSAVLTPELFASELFGYVKGAFTGANSTKKGLIEEADRGYLFFDEIGNILPAVQAGILRVLEDHKITPIGSLQSREVDVLFLSATNVDIETLAAAGDFRGDLLDRLREGGTIVIPPLRDRKSDMPLLVEKFVREAEERTPGALKRKIDSKALEKIIQHDWPGNIRELKQCIFEAVKDNPDVEYLVPGHIPIQSVHEATKRDEVTSRHSLDPCLEEQPVNSRENLFPFDINNPAELKGKLPELVQMLAQYLKIVCETTSSRTLENPSGDLKYQRAMEFAIGTKMLGTDAKRLISRILTIDPDLTISLLSDPTLKKIFKIANPARYDKLFPSQK